MWHTNKTITVPFISLLIASLVHAAPPPANVEVATVIRSPLTTSLTATGSLIANETVILRSEISGRVTAIHFQEGQGVKQGDELITLDQREQSAQVANAQAQLKLAELNFNRATELLKNNLISQQQYDETSAKMALAQAQLAVDQERLRKTVLRAPFPAQIGLRKISPGDFVQPGQDLVTLVDQHIIKVDFRIPEIYIKQIRSGLPIRVRTDALPGTEFKGEIYAVAPDVNVASRSLAVRAKIHNDKKLLHAGLFAHIDIELTSRNDAIVIPEQALWPIGDKQNVYKVVEGKAQLTPVTLGIRNNGQVEIREGLSAGDLIVTAGHIKIFPGAAVNPVSSKSEKAAGAP